MIPNRIRLLGNQLKRKWANTALSSHSVHHPAAAVECCRYLSTLDITTSNSANTSSRKNKVGVQLLSHFLYKQLFGQNAEVGAVYEDEDGPLRSNSSPSSNSDDLVLLAQKHLKDHDLLGKNIKDMQDISFPLPPLLTSSSTSTTSSSTLAKETVQQAIQDHFHILGTEQSTVFQKKASLLVTSPIPPRPKSWLAQAGWTQYTASSSSGPTETTDDVPTFSINRIDTLPAGEDVVFDVEVMYKVSPVPVLAVACSCTSWYVWVSESFAASAASTQMDDDSLATTTSPYTTTKTKERVNDDQSIPFGHADIPRLVVGHFVAYDRARIKEEYALTPSKIGFLDTLSLHAAVGGLSTQQRAKWQKYQKEKQIQVTEKEEEEQDNINSNRDEQSLISLEKDEDPGPSSSTSSSSKSKPKSSKKESPQTPILTDFQKEAVDFYNNFKLESDGTSAATRRWEEVGALNSLDKVAALHLGPEGGMLDKSVRKEFEESRMDRLAGKFQELVDYCANDVEVTFKLFKAVFPKYQTKCPHPVSFAGMMHMGKAYLTTGDNWLKYIENAESKCAEYRDEIEATLQALTKSALDQGKSNTHISDPWLCNLDWTVKPVKMTKEIRDSKTGKIKSPARPYASANLELAGQPQWYRDLWDTKAKRIKLSTAKKVVPYLLKLEWKGFPIFFNAKFGWMFHGPEIEVLKIIKGTGVDGDTLPIEPGQEFMIPGHVYFRIPHPSGEAKNVGNPLSKSFSVAFDKGILTSAYPMAKHLLTLNSYCIYWISARARIMSQFVVWPKNQGEQTGEQMNFGVIIPQTAVMGTVTRRATDATWMTASNAKPSRIGSELKAQITAPPGYKFVGADVDSEELWIASLIGDSQFGIHGATAIGFMTLQGTKALGTDLHSTSGRIVGISRDTAKIFNYSRIYGAGQNYAARLLVQHNPGLGKFEAQDKAAALYKQTKGLRFRDDKKTFGMDTFWYGGSESFMFNMLEKIAGDADSRTPVLGCQIPDTLMAEYVHDMFKTSRINWVVQSSGVDYLHLLLVSMDYLMRRMGIEGRFLLSIHDEVRFMIKEEHVAKAALALQISNLWTRCMFASKVGMNDLPLNAAFFSAVDIDHVMRKEVDMDCVTPSNTNPIEPGESQTIYQVLDSLKGADGQLPSDIYGHELQSILDCKQILEKNSNITPHHNDPTDQAESSMVIANSSMRRVFIKAQMCKSQAEVRRMLASPSNAQYGSRSQKRGAGTASRVTRART